MMESKKNIAIIAKDLNNGNLEKTAGFLSKILSTKYNVYLFLVDTVNIAYEYEGTIVDVGQSDPFYEYPIKKYKQLYDIDVSISFSEVMNFANVRSRGKERVVISQSCIHSMITPPRTSEIERIKRYYNYADEIVTCSEDIKCDLMNHYGVENKITIIHGFMKNDEIPPYSEETIKTISADDVNYKKTYKNEELTNKWIEIIENNDKKECHLLSREEEKLKAAEHIVIYGAGLVGKSYYLRMADTYKIDCFVVSKMEHNKNTLFGIPVLEIADLDMEKEKTVVIIGVGDSYQDEILDLLYQEGFRHIVYPDIEPLSIDYYTNNNELDIKKELSLWVKLYLGGEADIDSPQTYNEKIQWLKLHDNTPIKTKLADKIAVRDYIKEKIGMEYLIPLLGTWNSFEEIDFEKLPSKFVLKCNHGSGMGELIYDKSSVDYKDLKRNVDSWMQIDYEYMSGFEMHYAGIPHKILAETMLETDDGSDLKDYKVFVFNGKAKMIQVDIDRHHTHRRNLYTLDWEYLPYTILYPTAPEIILERPSCLDELIRLAEILGEGFIHVRVDFYVLKEKIYFGEMTFTHGSGVEPFIPESFAYEMGAWMECNI